jgi:hypothetical protein
VVLYDERSIARGAVDDDDMPIADELAVVAVIEWMPQATSPMTTIPATDAPTAIPMIVDVEVELLDVGVSSSASVELSPDDEEDNDELKSDSAVDDRDGISDSHIVPSYRDVH